MGLKPDTLAKIKDWEYGVLLLEAKDCRGIDTRFGKDAKVLIVASIATYSEYIQILGRSSRTRKVSDCILYNLGCEKAY